MRFTIDLLEGKGLPQKSQPGRIALAVVPFLIPVLASAVMAGGWFQKHAMIKNEQAVLRQNQQQIEQVADDLKHYEQIQTEILQARHEIKNIREALVYEIPASPLLAELVQTLPSGVFFHKLELQYNPVRRKVINPENNNAEYKRVIERSLRLVLAGPNRIESDQAVNGFIQTLRTCKALSSVAEDIQIASRQETDLDSQTMVLYEIKCSFIDQK